jgi:lipoate-protein ligase A
MANAGYDGGQTAGSDKMRRIRQNGTRNANNKQYNARMKYCELTLATPEENLACDEALLDECEAGRCDELLRVWEPAQYFVVVGYANRASTEVNLEYCRQNGIPVLRRCTGGGTVLQGPGCLNYSLILHLQGGGPFQSIAATNEFILRRHQAALTGLLRAPVQRLGQTDLAIGDLKFCGNAQRRRQRSLLFHGSFLLHLDLNLVEKALPMPSRQPDYRLNRSHADFLMNLKVPSHLVRRALAEVWGATHDLAEVPFEQINRLAREKYALEHWNFKF